MLNYPYSYLRGKCNNFIDTINPFNNLVYNKLSSHSIGARSLYLFIVVIYQFKCFFSDPELLHSKSYLSKIKKNILNCGCISIKFTQWIVSKLKGSDDNEKYSDVIEELEVLFDNCKYHDFKHTEDTFTDSLGMDISDIIDMNTLESIASGSIGQVYRAKFKDNCNLGSNNGPNSKFDFKEDIIIKVKHPDLEYIKTYQMILINFLALLQKIPYFKTKLQLHINFSDFIDMVNKQIDFNVEAVNCNKFQEIYKDNEYIVIPRIFKYSSSIIIASYEGGDYFFDISEYQKNKVAINLLALVGDMTLVQNFMHGDMHIKNWKVRKYKDNYQIVLYDFGICFSGPENEYNRQLWKAGEQQNVKKIIELFMSEIAYDNINKDKLINSLMDGFTAICEEPFNMNIVFSKLTYLFSVNNIIINSIFLNVLLFMCLIEDIFKKTNLICINDCGRVNTFKLAKNQKLDVIAFCKTHNVYPDLLAYYESEVKSIVEFENENIRGKKAKGILKDKDSIKLFNNYEISNLQLGNPDEIEIMVEDIDDENNIRKEDEYPLL
jgi:predicted unusual protein kinase regulating ubiquinone biosynthesis (AarF/ABC1/UbiB family)